MNHLGSSFTLLAAFLTFAHHASAQSCTPSDVSIKGLLGTVTPANASAAHTTANVPYTTINYADCMNGEALQFTFEASEATVDPLQMWAGPQDCGPLASRTPATAVCSPVAAPITPIATTSVATVNVRDIVASLTTGPKNTSYQAAPASICDALVTTDAPTTTDLYTFITDPSGNTCGDEVTYQVTVDLAAGSVPGAITTIPMAGGLAVNIPATTDADTRSWNVYVDPPPSADGDGGVTGEATCTSSVLTTSTSTPADGGPAWVGSNVPAKYLAASVGQNETMAFAQGLRAGVAYTVAVAAVDAAGNVGPLAIAPCGADSTPLAGEASTGGGATAGACALATPGAPGGAAFLGVGIFAIVAVARRRRAARS